MAMLFDDRELQDRRIQTLLSTAVNLQQLKQQKDIANQENAMKIRVLENDMSNNAIRNQIDLSKYNLDVLKARGDERKSFMDAGYTPTNRGQLLQMSPEDRRSALAGTTKDMYGSRYNQPKSIDEVISKLQSSGNVTPGTTIYDKKSGMRIPVNPKLTQEQADSVAAVNYITPRYERITSALNDSKLFEGNTFEKLAKQITVTAEGDLVVPDGHPLEDMIGAINDIKLTGFALGGKNFTESEQKILFKRLSPVGKSKARYMKDLNSLPDFFQAKINAMKGGMSGASEKGSKQVVTSGTIGDVDWEVIEE